MLILTLAAVLATASAPAAATAPAVAPVADPLAPARAGKVLCQRPNAEKKTCTQLNVFRFEDGKVFDHMEAIIVGPEPWVNIILDRSLEVRGDAVCETFGQFENVKVTKEGAPADLATVDEVKSLLNQAYKPHLGKEGCTTYVADGEDGGLRSHMKMAHLPQASPAVPVAWVDPAEGWAVKP